MYTCHSKTSRMSKKDTPAQTPAIEVVQMVRYLYLPKVRLVFIVQSISFAHTSNDHFHAADIFPAVAAQRR